MNNMLFLTPVSIIARMELSWFIMAVNAGSCNSLKSVFSPNIFLTSSEYRPVLSDFTINPDTLPSFRRIACYYASFLVLQPRKEAADSRRPLSPGNSI